MQVLEDALGRFAKTDRSFIEVFNAAGQLTRDISYRQVTRAAQELADTVLRPAVARQGRPPRVGVVCGNTPEFVVADLALLAAQATEVPVPLAFSRAQATGLLQDVDLCLVDDPGQRQLACWGPDEVLGARCPVHRLDLDDLLSAATRPYQIALEGGDWICKIIHTSGTTARPKGVRIRAEGLGALLRSLHSEMPHDAFRRYLSVVPFSLLIEQVTGLYLVILHGGRIILLPTHVPLVGTAPAAAAGAFRFLAPARPTALVATPSLVDEIATAADRAQAANLALIRTLFGTDLVPLICCGGAPMHSEVLQRLTDLGIPIYEGYGLSENSSVVTWNRPGAARIGTVGTPLPHVEVQLAADNEILVRSTSLFDGYTRDDPSSCPVDEQGWLHTGDLGAIDDDGFLRVIGRKKNMIITSSGRNIAPEWVEAQYATIPGISAVAVVGNDLEAIHGLFLVESGKPLFQIRAAIEAFGAAHLSEIDRVQVVHVMHNDKEIYRQYFTVTGRPIRAAIQRAVCSGAFSATLITAELDRAERTA
jgi:long-subunit acyl-CoA synthetase (AMP-forming)